TASSSSLRARLRRAISSVALCLSAAWLLSAPSDPFRVVRNGSGRRCWKGNTSWSTFQSRFIALIRPAGNVSGSAAFILTSFPSPDGHFGYCAPGIKCPLTFRLPTCNRFLNVGAEKRRSCLEHRGEELLNQSPH